MKKLIIASLLLFGLGAVAFVMAPQAETTTASSAPTSAPAGAVTYKADAGQSTLNWIAEKVTGRHDGTVGLSSGSFTMDGDKLTAGNFEINMQSIKCLDITDQEMNGKLIGHLNSDDFFSVQKHPKAIFKLKNAKMVKAGKYEVTGDLTIKGKTNPVTFPIYVTRQGKQIIANGEIVLDRTKWDVQYGSGSLFDGLGDKMIYDNFNVKLRVVANS